MNTILFFDDEPLNLRENAGRRSGRPQLITGSVYHDPHGNCTWGYPGVFRDAVTGRWRMVYGLSAQAGGGGGLMVLAESEDGLRWHPRDTTAEIQIDHRVVPHQLLPLSAVRIFSSLFVDDLADSAHRLKALVVGDHHRGAIWSSADGLHWEELPGSQWQPLIPDPPSFVHWNAVRDSYVITSRPRHSDRRICVIETRDWQTFTPPELALHCDALDRPLTQTYAMAVLPYEGIYVGLLWLFHCAPSDTALAPHKYLGGKQECHLACSQNGWHWQRSLRTPFIPPGEPGDPDSGCVQPSCAVTLPDGSLRIYASTSRHEHGHCPLDDGYIVAYDLRRDGFVWLESDGGRGLIGTRALYWQGGEVELNVQAPAGWVRVQVTTPKGVPVPGYTFADSAVFQGDNTGWTPEWKDGKRVAALADKLIRLEIQLENARLYAIRGNFVQCRLDQVNAFETAGAIPALQRGY